MYCLSTFALNSRSAPFFERCAAVHQWLLFALAWSLVILCLLYPALACGAPSSPSDNTLASSSSESQGPYKKILVVGDSLSAEYGLIKGQGWVALLEEKLKAEHRSWRVINSSISGDTTSGGLARLPALLATHRPQVVVLELGANDALRGLDLKMTQSNLQSMAKLCQQAHAKLLLLGMQVPPNYGRQYNEDLKATYVLVAQLHRSMLVPFFFQGLVDHIAKLPGSQDPTDAWFQADRIHPLAKAHPYILQGIWPTLRNSMKD